MRTLITQISTRAQKWLGKQQKFSSYLLLFLLWPGLLFPRVMATCLQKTKYKAGLWSTLEVEQGSYICNFCAFPQCKLQQKQENQCVISKIWFLSSDIATFRVVVYLLQYDCTSVFECMDNYYSIVLLWCGSIMYFFNSFSLDHMVFCWHQGNDIFLGWAISLLKVCV